MTPAEHIATAESLADKAMTMDNDWSEAERIAVCILSLTHAVIAAAVELGAPHAAAPTSGASSG